MCGLLPAVARAEPPQLPAWFADPPPVIDGVLDDPCWADAPRIQGFYFPTENRPATEDTECWIAIDDDHLYAAFYAHDSRPETIMAQQTQRGGAIDRDDYVVLHVDPSRRQIDHFSFRVTANGTQNDTIPNSGSGNIAWAGDWTAAARRVVDGYQVELAIPFTTLRYPAGQTTFGITFGRNLEREQEGSFWPEMKDRFDEPYMAILGPMTLKTLTRRPAILPYAILRGDGDGVTLQSGLDAKHVFSNDITALFTLNPDFANIEDVVETIAFSDVPRYLDDTRPFFREGLGYFPNKTALDTRRIPGVSTGLKSFGQLGPHEFGALGTLSGHGRLDGTFDYTYNFDVYHSLGTGLVYTNGSAPTNVVSATHFDGLKDYGRGRLTYSADYYQSLTEGPGDDGASWTAAIDYSGDGILGWDASYGMVRPSFHAELGYVPEPDQKGWTVGLHGTRRKQDTFLITRSWDFSHTQKERTDGSLLIASTSLTGDLRLGNGTKGGLRFYSANRPPNRDRTVGGVIGWGLDSLAEEGALELTYGDRGGADYLFARLTQGWNPIPPLRFGLTGEWTSRGFHDGRPHDSRTQTVLTATYELSPYSTINGRFVERDGKLNLFLAYRNAPTSGRAWYIFFGDPNAERTEARLQFKVIWPL